MPKMHLDRFLRFPDVKEITTLSRSTIWRKEKNGTFPKHVMIGAHIAAWRASEIEAWVKGEWKNEIVK